MIYSEPARATTGQTRIRWIRVAGLVGVIAAIAAALGTHRPASSSPSTTAARPHRLHPAHRVAPGEGAAPPMLGGSQRAALGEADGAVPDGTTVFDRGTPGVAKLDPALLGALRRAATAAAGAGVVLHVDSGWRSPRYQEHLLGDAISTYGSQAEALRWVATPSTSAHVKGEAVDIGPSQAAAWLREHGAAYGLCQVYANEPWHYELRPDASGHGCPAMYADPTRDPRMQQ